MAKFKVGDRVKTRMPNGGWSDTVVIERIIESDGKKLYVCRTGNGTYPAHEWDIRLSNSRAANCGVRSTIPAVNAALGANAVKPGDMVKVEWEYDADKKGIVGMTGEVLKISSGIATVAIREKGNREYIVAGHALRKIVNAARNSAARNAAYSNTLTTIIDSVKPYMDKRIKGDTSWRYPMYVITVLRKVCDRAVMSAGRYDGKRPPHRIYDLECEKDGFKFNGNLIVTGLLHRDDDDDVSAFDEYDMTLSLMYAGKVA